MSRTDLLRDRSVVALLIAEVVSTTGAQMTWLALPWFVLVTTGSATKTTFVAAAEVIGLALLGLPGGRVLGRLGARRTMMLCDGARAPLMVIIPVLHWTGGLSFGVLLVVAFALGALTAPYFAAQKVIVPELLGEDEKRLTEANALFQGATRTTMLAGPALGGLLIGFMGATSVLLIDAATYVVAVVLVAAFVPRRPPLPQDEEDRSIRAGVRFVARDPLLRVWWPAFALGDAAWTAFFISVPVLVADPLRPPSVDRRLADRVVRVGALVGNVVAFRYLARRLDGLTIIAMFVMFQALPLWLLWFDLPAAGYSVAILLSGIANGLVNPSLHTISTVRVPPKLRANVLTTTMVGWAVVNPLGLFLAGPILDAFGTKPVMIGFAAMQTLTMAIVATASVRELGRRRQLEPLEAAA